MRRAPHPHTTALRRASAPLLAFALAALAALAAPAMATDAPADTAVLQPVHAFFGGMSRYDQAAMRAQVLPEGTATLMRHGKPVQLTLGAFVDRVKPGKDRIEERIGTPQVLIDDDRDGLGALHLPARRQAAPLRHRRVQPGAGARGVADRGHRGQQPRVPLTPTAAAQRARFSAARNSPASLSSTPLT